nr:fibrinogen alpha chain-like [Drosophila bipectinata]
MIFPAALISVLFLISASLGSEESCYLSEEQEDQCSSVCYPIVKPLLRYFEKTNEKDTQLAKCNNDNSELHKRYSNLLERHSEVQKKYTDVLIQLSDEKVRYEKLLSKQQEVDNLVNQKNKEIELLNEQNRYLEKTSELATLTSKFSKEIDKIGEIVKAGEVITNQLAHINNQTTSKTETIDPCPRDFSGRVLREIQIPGSDPFKVVCVSTSKIGSGWLKVYSSVPSSEILNRTYEEYERGFGDFGPLRDDEFFIGLKRLHLLTIKNHYEIILDTTAGYKRCDHFVVGVRREGYEVKNIENCTGPNVRIIPKLGSKFSTFDRDEDGVSGRNLAKELGFGWWFDPNL